MLDHLQLRRIRLTVLAGALVVAAPAAHAFTMDTIANSNGGARYTGQGDQFDDMSKGKTTTQQDAGGLHFGFGPSSGYAPGSRIGAPPDQSRFNDR